MSASSKGVLIALLVCVTALLINHEQCAVKMFELELQMEIAKALGCATKPSLEWPFAQGSSAAGESAVMKKAAHTKNTKTTTPEQQVHVVIAEIKERLETIESYMGWLIRADQRFQIGQRVEWSRKGRRCGYPRRKVAQRGTVKGLKSFGLTVLLDGYAQPHTFHHSFFNPVSGSRLMDPDLTPGERAMMVQGLDAAAACLDRVRELLPVETTSVHIVRPHEGLILPG